MALRTLQSAFTGEVSPSMYGRIDNDKYKTGLAVCRNFICLPQGPVQNRSGFEFVRPAKYADKPSRLIAFEFSSTDTMILEFGHHYIRFHSKGGTLLTESGAPYEIATPYISDDLFVIHYAQSADVMTLVHPSYPVKELRRHGPYDWRLVDVVFQAPLSPPTITQAEYVANGNESDSRFTYRYKVTAIEDTEEGQRESAPSQPASVSCNLWWDNALNRLSWTAVPGASRYRVYKSTAGVFGYIGETESTSFEDNRIDADDGITPPRYDALFSTRAISSVTVLNGGSGYAITGKVRNAYIDKEGLPGTEHLGFCSYITGGSTNYPAYPEITAKVLDHGSGTGAEVSLELVKRQWYDYSSSDNGDTYTWYSTVYVTGFKLTKQGSGYSSPYIQFYKDGTAVNAFEVYGVNGPNSLIVIQGLATSRFAKAELSTDEGEISLQVSDSTGSGAQLTPVVSNGKITAVQVNYGGADYTNPTVSVSSSQGSGASFSVKVSEGASAPSAVAYFEQRKCYAGSVARPQFVWMTRSGTENDMAYHIPVLDDDRIKFKIAAQKVSRIKHLVPLSQLLALSESAIFRLSPANSDIITPESVSAKPQVYQGASEVQPLLIKSNMIYVAERGGHVIEMGYNWQMGGFAVNDLCVFAPHLFEKARVNDMALAMSPHPIIWCAMSDGSLLGLTYMPEQAVSAWHRHDTEQGAFESVAVVPEGDEDILYAVVRRTINGQTVRYVERMHERLYKGLDNCFHVDSGATYVGAEIQTVTGLGHLEGCEVAILADGAVLPRRKVVDGKITLEVPAQKIHIGLPITSELQTLPLLVNLQDGSFGRGHQKNVNRVWMQVYQSSGIFVGPSFENLTEAKQRFDEPYGVPPEPLSTEIDVPLPGSWSPSGQLVLRQKDPLPLTLVGITCDLAQ